MSSENRSECRQEHHCRKGRNSSGPSSAWLHEPDMVLRQIPLRAGHVFVDLGCGSGDYTIEAAKIVGASGKVYALDKWEYLIKSLSKTAECRRLGITALTSDITAALPIPVSFLLLRYCIFLT